MTEYFVVEIKMCGVDGEIFNYLAEHRSLELATRDILTYKPKKGRYVYNWEIRRESRLF